MNVTINLVELATELAENEMIKYFSESLELYSDEDEDCIVYTDEAQDIFDELYDKYYAIIENTQVNS
jgi:hypothetical protein